MRLSDLVDVLESIAPTRYAEPWDNVGLLAGDPAAEVSHALMAIDYTPAVAAEGRALGCDVVVAYHPPIFDAVKRFTAGSVVFEAVRDGVAIYSPHTALDVADGGTNDVLADVVGIVDRAPLRLTPAQATQYKLVTFVPEEELETVSLAIFEAGAGRIGKYSSCSFRSPGWGTFFGEEGTSPAVGRSGRLERAAEVRLETVVAVSDVGAVVRALRQAHPYEEPAFDLNLLAAVPQGRGQGRVGAIEPATRRELIERIRQGLGLEHLLVAGPSDGEARSAAVCAGACGDLLNDALAARVDLLLTGEIRHHDALRAANEGMTVVCALHSNSERAALKPLKARLEAGAEGLKVTISEKDRDAFEIA